MIAYPPFRCQSDKNRICAARTVRRTRRQLHGGHAAISIIELMWRQ